MNLKKKVRVAVSKDRIRFNDKKHNLDLSYITNNLIAMAFPATGIEATYRNDIDEVSRMLHTYHKNNYMIWNLSGRLYDYSKFNHQVLNFGFPDHHSPPLDLLFQIIVSMDNWLSASPEHVAVIHCVGGKGRTGTVISCYLIFTGYFADPQEALLHFAYMRSMKERGVTQTSQKRYVTYFQNILRNTVRPHPKVLRIRRVVMTAVPCWTKQGCRPYVNIYHTRSMPRQLVHTTRYGTQTKFYNAAEESSSIIWDVDCMVKGDVLIKFYHLKENKEKVLDKTKEGSKKKFEQSMFRFSFHTAFVELEQGGLILKKGDLDIYHKPKRFRDSIERDEFGVIVIMEEVEEHMAQLYGEEDAAITATYEQFFQKITSERIRTRHESLLVVNDEDEEESNADSDAETDEELEENSDGDDDESSSCGQGDLERSTSSDAVPESVPKTGSEVVRQREKEKEKEKKKEKEKEKNEAASSKSEGEATGAEGKERKKSESDEGSTEKDDGSAEEKGNGAVEEKEEKGAPSTRPPEKALKKKGSMRAIRKKLSKLKKASDGSGSSIRRRKKDSKPAPSDDEQEASDKSEIRAGDAKAKPERTLSDKGADGAGTNGETEGGRVSSALASSLSADLSASGKKHRRPVTVYAKARHSEDTSNGNTGVNIGRRDGTTDPQLCGTTPPKGSEGAPGDAKSLEPGAVGSAGVADKGDDDDDAEAMTKAKLRLRSTSLKDVLASGKSERRPDGAIHLLLGSARGPTPQKPLPPTPAALAVVDTTEEKGGKADADVEGAGTDDRPPSRSPPSSPIFSPGSRSHMRGADGGAARRSAGASLSSHRCSVATPSSLGRPHEG